MLYGTHLGPFRGLPPTGRKFEMRFCAIFVFEEDRLVCERVYFDAGTILRQLGIAHDPLTLTRAGRDGRQPPAHDRPRARLASSLTAAERRPAHFSSRESGGP